MNGCACLLPMLGYYMAREYIYSCLQFVCSFTNYNIRHKITCQVCKPDHYRRVLRAFYSAQHASAYKLVSLYYKV